jgi:hypothetical protein
MKKKEEKKRKRKKGPWFLPPLLFLFSFVLLPRYVAPRCNLGATLRVAESAFFKVHVLWGVFPSTVL